VDLYQQFVSLSQIIIIDLVLAGDNAVVVGLAASRVDPRLRAKVIFWGVAGAVVLRVLFALVATQLLAVVGLTLAGGVLLLWVCWKMYREIVVSAPQPAFAGAGGHSGPAPIQTMSFYAALTQIIIADVSMSLDNVLAVAGAAKGDLLLLAVGLTIAVVLMAVASAYIARLLSRYHWITWIGLLVIVYVALEMVWSGTQQVSCRLGSRTACESGLLPALTALFT
jgi:YjbE family integral membrane protein